MIQDIYPHVLDNQFKQGKRATAKCPVLHFKGNSLYINTAYLKEDAATTRDAQILGAIVETAEKEGASSAAGMAAAAAAKTAASVAAAKAPAPAGLATEVADMAADVAATTADAEVTAETAAAALGDAPLSVDEPKAVERAMPFLPTYGELYGRQSAMSVAMIVNGRMSNSNGSVTYLLTLDDTDYYFACGPEIPALEGYDYVSIARLRQMGLPMEQMLLIMTALHLSHWYDNNHYCGHCGSRMVIARTERVCKCPACRNRSYPRINPAVIIGVRNGDKLLMTKYAGQTGQAVPYFALVAGFTEIGETLEQTVEREVMEEVGLKVKNITYYKSQPWGLADDILVGFYCDVDGDDTITMDKRELKVAEWYTRDEISGQPDNLSLTNEMMLTFKAGLDK